MWTTQVFLYKIRYKLRLYFYKNFEEGIKICTFDDGFGATFLQSPSIDLVLEEAEFARNRLTQCGFIIINSEKSVWQPQKEPIWLRIKLNYTFTLYNTCIPNHLNYGIHPIHHKNLPYTTAPNLSKLWQIISTIFLLGNIAQLKARNSHIIIRAELIWDRHTRLHENDKASQGIIFWRNNLMKLNSY